jgi:hypothetical protein
MWSYISGTPPVLLVDLDERGRAFVGGWRVRLKSLPQWIQEWARSIRRARV